MELLTVYPEPTIERRVCDLLLGSLGARGQEIWLVSPWITDFEIDLTDRGLFAPSLGSAIETVRLSGLLAVLAQDNAVNIVSRPPDVHFGWGNLTRLVELFAARSALASGPASDAAHLALALLERESDAVIGALQSHIDTVRFCRDMRGRRGVTLWFNRRLHAKLLCTPSGAITGSANFTRSGMHYNDELSLQADDATDVAQLRAASRTFCDRRHAVLATKYSLRGALSPAEREAFAAVVASDLLPPGPREFLLSCAADW